MNQQVATLPATAHVSSIRAVLMSMRVLPKPKLSHYEAIEKHLHAIEAELRKKRGEA